MISVACAAACGRVQARVAVGGRVRRLKASTIPPGGIKIFVATVDAPFPLEYKKYSPLSIRGSAYGRKKIRAG